MNIYTFRKYWNDFHQFTNKAKTNKAQAYNTWFRCMNCELKKKAIQSCKLGLKTELNGFEYLKLIIKL